MKPSPLHNEATRILVAAGVLGIGIKGDELEKGLAMKPHAMALDAGSTDSGPAALATGISKYSRQATKRDLKLLMKTREKAKVPLLIGSCGTSGCDQAVDWTLDIVTEIAREEGITPRIALIYSEQDKNVLKAKAKAGQVTPLAPCGELTDETIDKCSHIVALLGPEPYVEAMKNGADIVLGGRTTDTAVLAATALMRGADTAATWHAAKIGECGGLCSVNPTMPGIMLTVDQNGFEIEPLDPANRCTPETVSAHMLYENSDPFHLVEPGGVLNVEQAHYEALDSRRVRVTGARFDAKPYTMKLEGAGGGPFQTFMLVGIEDPLVLENIDGFVARMHADLTRRTKAALGADAEPFDISLRPYGWNAVSGLKPPPGTPIPREIGLMFIATARTQALATQIAKTCNPMFFHMPVREGKEMPSYGFPFSPAEVERGEVCEFHLNHVVATTSPSELVRTRWVDLAAERPAKVA